MSVTRTGGVYPGNFMTQDHEERHRDWVRGAQMEGNRRTTCRTEQVFTFPLGLGLALPSGLPPCCGQAGPRVPLRQGDTEQRAEEGGLLPQLGGRGQELGRRQEGRTQQLGTEQKLLPDDSSPWKQGNCWGCFLPQN